MWKKKKIEKAKRIRDNLDSSVPPSLHVPSAEKYLNDLGFPVFVSRS